MEFGDDYAPLHDWGGRTGELVLDLGMHTGDDADYYLHRGFRVVGVEAHPELCEANRKRFAKALDSGQLVIENVAIAEAPEVTFYASSNDQWGTIYPEWVSRNEKLGERVVATMTVPGVDVTDLVRTYGIPYFVKIDIEGADMLVLHGLEKTDVRPPYLSIESTKTSWAGLVGEIDQLERMGYDEFQAVAQHNIGRPGGIRDDGAGYEFSDWSASGPLGDRLPGPWRDRRAILREYRRIFWRYRLFGDAAETGILPRRLLAALLVRILGWPGWWDTHARHRSAPHHRRSDP